jgi:phosphatidylserine decarboxylase
LDQLFITLQQLLPQHLLSRATGWLARSEIPWLKKLLIDLFASHFKVHMAQAQEPELGNYRSFNDFFTRALAPDARPIDASATSIVCPADGAISQLGNIEDGRIFQAKGQSFSVEELLAGDFARAEAFHNGRFATIYLSPRDYHRVHMPLAGKLTAQTYVPGDLFSVNQVTAERVERLFARNERLICYFDTAIGPMAVVLVGAMIVAGIETVWSGQVAPPPRLPRTVDYQLVPEDIALAKGEEMGRFMLGSTAIVLFPPDSIEWDEAYAAGSPTRLGEVLGSTGNHPLNPV